MNHVWKSVEGFTGGGIPQLYADMVKHYANGSHFVEVGPFLGQSTALMIVEIINSGKDISFDCVDIWEKLPTFSDGQLENEHFKRLPHDYFPVFKENLERYDLFKHVNPIRGDSISVSKQYEDDSLDFVFVDANHSYESVKKDIEAWMPKVKKGGILSGHDYARNNNGVKQAVVECIGKIKLTGAQCWWYKKP